MEHSFTPSELIDLFLDGEHSCVERSVLFKELSHNSDLQEEFEEALKIRSAVFQEVSTSVPPTAVTSGLMKKAGFASGAAYLTGTHALSDVHTPFWSKLLNIHSATFMAFILPAITAVGGFLLGGFAQAPLHSLYNSIAESPASNTLTTDLKKQINQQQLFASHQNIRALPYNVGTDFAHTLRTAVSTFEGGYYATTSSYNSLPEQTSTHATGEHSVSSRTIFRKNTHSANTKQVVHTISTANDAHSNTNMPNIAPTDNNTAQTVALNDPNSPVTLPTMPLNTTKQLSAINTFEQSREGMITYEEHTEVPWDVYSFALSLRGIHSLRVTQENLVNPSTNIPANNISVGVQIPISKHFSAISEVGQETFPLYMVSNDELVLRQSMVFMSAGVRYTMNPIQSLYSIQPILQTQIGGTTAGPLVRSIAGVTWQPDNKVILLAGFEAMSLMYRYNNTQGFAHKLGLTYGISIKF